MRWAQSRVCRRPLTPPHHINRSPHHIKSVRAQTHTPRTTTQAHAHHTRNAGSPHRTRPWYLLRTKLLSQAHSTATGSIAVVPRLQPELQLHALARFLHPARLLCTGGLLRPRRCVSGLHAPCAWWHRAFPRLAQLWRCARPAPVCSAVSAPSRVQRCRCGARPSPSSPPRAVPPARPRR